MGFRPLGQTAGCGRALNRQLKTVAGEPIKQREAAHEYSLPKVQNRTNRARSLLALRLRSLEIRSRAGAIRTARAQQPDRPRFAAGGVLDNSTSLAGFLRQGRTIQSPAAVRINARESGSESACA